MPAKRLGMTIVEMVFTLALATLAIGSTVTLYGYVAIRSGDAATQYNVYQQSTDLVQAMQDAASNAIQCQNVTVGSVTALKCTMPNSGTDSDNDGIIDKYQPTGVYKTLREYYSPGKRIWFFPSTKSPTVGTAGNFWFRAVRTDDSNPTTDTIDTKWSYVTGTTPRIYIPGTVTFVQNSSNFSTWITLAIDTTINPNSQVKGYSGDLALKMPAITLVRRCYWRGGK